MDMDGETGSRKRENEAMLSIVLRQAKLQQSSSTFCQGSMQYKLKINANNRDNFHCFAE